jgi:hypothetical protein
MKRHAIEALEVLNRRRYARRNFLTALLGGSEQNRRKEIGALCEAGYLTKHAPNGAGAIERAYRADLPAETCSIRNGPAQMPGLIFTLQASHPSEDSLPFPWPASAIANMYNPQLIAHNLVIDFVGVPNDCQLVDAKLVGCGCDEWKIGKPGNPALNEVLNLLRSGRGALIQVGVNRIEIAVRLPRVANSHNN